MRTTQSPEQGLKVDELDAARGPGKRNKVEGHQVLHELGRFGLVIVFAGVLVFFSIMRPETFATSQNFRWTLDSQAIILLTAFAAMVTLLVGEFDLSVGANAGLASLFAVGLCSNQSFSPVVAMILAIAISTAIGAINGLIVIGLNVNSFVATLGMATLLAGAGSLYTDGQDLPTAPAGLGKIGAIDVLGLPITVVVALLTGVVLFTYLQRLPAGRKLLAVGANRRAAELTGIQPRLRIFGAFVTTGAICGLGGALYGAQLGSASLSTGSTLMLPAFAGAFLGATAITPGRFNVIGTVVGVLFLAFTVSGLQQMGVSAWAQDVVTGFALVASVALSTWAARIRMARLRKAQLENILGA